MAQHTARLRRVRVAATVALSVLLGIGTLARRRRACRRPPHGDRRGRTISVPTVANAAMPLHAPMSSWTAGWNSRAIRPRACRGIRRGPRTRSTTATGSSSITASGSSGTCSRRGGSPATRPTATEASYLLRDWVRDNPRGAGRSAFSWNDHSTAIRTFVLACAAVVAPKASWIREALRTHGGDAGRPRVLRPSRQPRAQPEPGSAGCRLHPRSPRLAATGGETGSPRCSPRASIAQGVTNEQSIYYQLYNLEAYRAAADAAAGMRHDGPAGVPAARSDDRLLTHATLPDGTYATLGDTSHAPARAIGGTTAAYAATEGREGPKLQLRRSRHSRLGSRSAGRGGGPRGHSRTRSMWSARFGPGRAFHGHLDHGAVTLYGYGQRLVDDPGLFTMNNNRWREFAISRAAHNVVTVDATSLRGIASSATLARATTAAHVRRHHDPRSGLPGVDLRRRIVFSHGLGWLLVDDHATSAEPSGPIGSSGISCRAPIRALDGATVRTRLLRRERRRSSSSGCPIR